MEAGGTFDTIGHRFGTTAAGDAAAKVAALRSAAPVRRLPSPFAIA